MSIAAETRDHDGAVQRHVLSLTGVDQYPTSDPRLADARWTRYARCGQGNEGADPELFFAVEADSQSTYAARDICIRCPVREWCDAAATEERRPGVWGGIYRDNHGNLAPLCKTFGCMRYQRLGKPYCRACYAAREAEETSRDKGRPRSVAAEPGAATQPVEVDGPYEVDLTGTATAELLEVIGA